MKSIGLFLAFGIVALTAASARADDSLGVNRLSHLFTNLGGIGAMAIDQDILCIGTGNGLHTWDISDPTALDSMGWFEGYGFGCLAARGNLVAVRSHVPYALYLFDVSDPTLPTLISTIDRYEVLNLYLTNSLLIAQPSNGDSNIYAYDITNPSEPTELSPFVVNAEATALSWPYFYVAEHNEPYLRTYDIRDWDQIEETSCVELERCSWLAVLGDLMLVGMDYGYYGYEILLFDISDPSQPVELSQIKALVYWPGNISRYRDYLYIPDETHDSLAIYDVSDREQPALVGSLSSPYYRTPSLVYGQYLIAGANRSDIRVYSLENDPVRPELVYERVDLPQVTSMYASGTHVYAGLADLGIGIADISNPLQPTVLGFLELNEGSASPHTLRGGGDFLYAACGKAGWYIINIGQPDDPEVVFSSSDFDVRDLDIKYPYAFLATAEDGIQIYNIHNPEEPELISSWPSDTTISRVMWLETCLAAVEQWDYIGRDTIAIINVSDINNPRTIKRSVTFGNSWSAADTTLWEVGYDPDIQWTYLGDPRHPIVSRGGGNYMHHISIVPNGHLVICSRNGIEVFRTPKHSGGWHDLDRTGIYEKSIGVVDYGSSIVQDTLILVSGFWGVQIYDATLALESNFSPYWVSHPDTVVAVEGDTIHFELSAADRNLDTLTIYWSASGHQRPYMRFHDNGDGTASFTWATKEGWAGIYNPYFVVYDGELRDTAWVVIDLQSLTDVARAEVQPTEFRLLGAFPNPFNSSTTIRFNLPTPGPVHLEVYDPLGRRVRDLIGGTWMGAGEQRVMMKMMMMPSGSYLLRLKAGDRTGVIEVSLVK